MNRPHAHPPWQPSRREFLYVGLLGTVGLTMSDLFRPPLCAAGATRKLPVAAKAKSVINIYLPGGMSHQESFDPKLTAPIEYRGPMEGIKTSLPGVYFSENLKETAKIADKITVIRSMTHGEAAHERGTHAMFTGYRPSPALQYPSIGSVVAHELGPRADLPPYILVPNQVTPYEGTGYLGAAYGPFALGSDPATDSFSVRDLTLPGGVDPKRFEQRREMRAVVDAHFSALEKSDVLDGMDSFYQRAYAMISSEKARAAFDIKAEPSKVRETYGRNAAGQRMLLARRLVEAGVRFVSLTYGSWDHHDNIKRANSNQMPNFDKAYAALIRDLDERGLLDSTLVIVNTEFGRTPKVNGTAGRDHWPKVFSIALAGGGVKRGQIYGASDATGAEPEDNPLRVEDYAATIFNQIGIDPEKKLMSPGGRPQSIVKDGRVVKELLA
ncbi:MAG: DUF1501 domain-containing protein [Verrucomicrobia bacterium]|nr:DUF1501 domain-containing protein [Verrucomicrobiota bacterium]